MAEGLLVEKDGDDMESLGSKVYDILLQNCFFQEAKKDEFGIIEYAKMHDLVHDLACSISKAESFNVENHKSDVPIPPRVRNLAIRSLDDHESYKMALNYLRALFSNDKIPDSVLDDCKNLRTLALQENTKELSPSIAKLIHLRFIDVSFTKIRAFPESICQLYNLQTLRAIQCPELQELPSQLRSLISLRHLVVDREEHFEMPIEIGKLTCLRTLKFFNVGNENSRRIEELGYLKNLKGAVAIHKLEHVNGKEEAARACLTEKPNIHKLKLVWSGSREGNNFNDEQVLEGLEPPPNIQSLSIEWFCGDNLPSWIMNRSISDQVIRLEKLIELKLIDCERCLEIPTLGHLPLLKFLTLIGLGNIRSIGPRFYYPRNYGVNEYRRRGNNQLAFPALERFILSSMANLEEWTELYSTDSYQVVNAFPRLEYLNIFMCPNISRFPSHGFPCLKELVINDVERGGLLLDRIHNNNSTSLTSLTLENVLDVTYLPKRLFYDNQRIMYMCIANCPSLTHIELWAHNLESLDRIDISSCKKLKSIRYLTQGEEESSGGFISSLQTLRVYNCNEVTEILSPMVLECCTSLQTLCVSRCHNLVSFPIDFRSLPSSLCSLDISKCPRLRSLPKGGIQQLQLWRLELYGWPQFESLPDDLQHLTTLKHFRIDNFGMEALPEWIGNLASLEWLGLCRCKKLKQLPSKEALQFHISQLSRWYDDNH
ncbi:Disease resistance protein RGA5 [Sesamum angolense]|uniref:Disease resistance protein RGA5 n=1 Tax=Sesamum angolense TaxID=2727404 RepID=A0AAE2C535_9LAMI|nr:Disease resistance protein RGA5 [Sesamum angolense]